MPTYNGVIETATGDLKRAGYCDFENDGKFDAGTETYRTDVPRPSYRRGDDPSTKMTRWDGAAWILVDQP